MKSLLCARLSVIMWMVVYCSCTSKVSEEKTILGTDEVEWYDRGVIGGRTLKCVSSTNPAPGLYVPIMEWGGIRLLPWVVEVKADGSGIIYNICDTPNGKQRTTFAWKIDANMAFVMVQERTNEERECSTFLGFLGVYTLKGECHPYMVTTEEEVGSTYMELGNPGKKMTLFPFDVVDRIVTKGKGLAGRDSVGSRGVR